MLLCFSFELRSSIFGTKVSLCINTIPIHIIAEDHTEWRSLEQYILFVSVSQLERLRVYTCICANLFVFVLSIFVIHVLIGLFICYKNKLL